MQGLKQMNFLLFEPATSPSLGALFHPAELPAMKGLSGIFAAAPRVTSGWAAREALQQPEALIRSFCQALLPGRRIEV